jgi:hypothetical protein
MKAVSRVKGCLLIAAAAMAPAIAAAQQTPPSNQSNPDSIGLRELQNFKLPGTVTRPADQPAANPPADRPQTAPVSSNAPAARSRVVPPARRSAMERAAPKRPVSTSSAQTLPDSAATNVAPGSSATASSAPPPTRIPPAAPASDPAPAPAAIPLYAWLLAALILGAGAAVLIWRNRTRQALAGHDEGEFVVPPVERVVSPPAQLSPSPPPVLPDPTPAPAPQPKVAAAPSGIVSTRLRPWVEIAFNPVRCVIDLERATVDFEIELFNSGSAPARNVVVAATAFNAGPTQDAVINSYFEKPSGQGHPVDAVLPMERRLVPLQLTMPRDQLQPYELGGHQVFVPLLAATVTYAWSSGEGQTSASYLIGRGTAGDKLGPFRIDAGPRIFRGLGAKPLPTAIRR